MTGSYCEAALIKGTKTEERFGILSGKLKKKSSKPWKAGGEDKRLLLLHLQKFKKFGLAFISS